MFIGQRIYCRNTLIKEDSEIGWYQVCAVYSTIYGQKHASTLTGFFHNFYALQKNKSHVDTTHSYISIHLM